MVTTHQDRYVLSMVLKTNCLALCSMIPQRIEFKPKQLAALEATYYIFIIICISPFVPRGVSVDPSGTALLSDTTKPLLFSGDRNVSSVFVIKRQRTVEHTGFSQLS